MNDQVYHTSVLQVGDSQDLDLNAGYSPRSDADEILQLPETVLIKEELPPDYFDVEDPLELLRPPSPPPPAPPPPRLVPRPLASLCYATPPPPPSPSAASNRTPWRVQEEEEVEEGGGGGERGEDQAEAEGTTAPPPQQQQQVCSSELSHLQQLNQQVVPYSVSNSPVSIAGFHRAPPASSQPTWIYSQNSQAILVQQQQPHQPQLVQQQQPHQPQLVQQQQPHQPQLVQQQQPHQPQLQQPGRQYDPGVNLEPLVMHHNGQHFYLMRNMSHNTIVLSQPRELQFVRRGGPPLQESSYAAVDQAMRQNNCYSRIDSANEEPREGIGSRQQLQNINVCDENAQRYQLSRMPPSTQSSVTQVSGFAQTPNAMVKSRGIDQEMMPIPQTYGRGLKANPIKPNSSTSADLQQSRPGRLTYGLNPTVQNNNSNVNPNSRVVAPTSMATSSTIRNRVESQNVWDLNSRTNPVTQIIVPTSSASGELHPHQSGLNVSVNNNPKTREHIHNHTLCSANPVSRVVVTPCTGSVKLRAIQELTENRNLCELDSRTNPVTQIILPTSTAPVGLHPPQSSWVPHGLNVVVNNNQKTQENIQSHNLSHSKTPITGSVELQTICAPKANQNPHKLENHNLSIINSMTNPVTQIVIPSSSASIEPQHSQLSHAVYGFNRTVQNHNSSVNSITHVVAPTSAVSAEPRATYSPRENQQTVQENQNLHKNNPTTNTVTKIVVPSCSAPTEPQHSQLSHALYGLNQTAQNHNYSVNPMTRVVAPTYSPRVNQQTVQRNQNLQEISSRSNPVTRIIIPAALAEQSVPQSSPKVLVNTNNNQRAQEQIHNVNLSHQIFSAKPGPGTSSGSAEVGASQSVSTMRGLCNTQSAKELPKKQRATEVNRERKQEVADVSSTAGRRGKGERSGQDPNPGKVSEPLCVEAKGNNHSASSTRQSVFQTVRKTSLGDREATKWEATKWEEWMEKIIEEKLKQKEFTGKREEERTKSSGETKQKKFTGKREEERTKSSGETKQKERPASSEKGSSSQVMVDLTGDASPLLIDLTEMGKASDTENVILLDDAESSETALNSSGLQSTQNQTVLSPTVITTPGRSPAVSGRGSIGAVAAPQTQPTQAPAIASVRPRISYSRRKQQLQQREDELSKYAQSPTGTPRCDEEAGAGVKAMEAVTSPASVEKSSGVQEWKEKECLLSREQEAQLVAELTELATSFDGLSVDELVTLTSEFLEAVRVSSSQTAPGSAAEQIPPLKLLVFVRQLVKDHPRLCAVTLQFDRKQRRSDHNALLSAAHSRLKMAMHRGKFKPSEVFTVDAEALSYVTTHLPEKKGLTEAVLSVLTAVSAAGWASSPLLVLAGQDQEELPRRAAEGGMSVVDLIGAMYALSSDGRVTATIFEGWLRRFLDRNNCSPQRPILMILVDHPACKNLAVLRMCRARGVTLVGLPQGLAHCSPLLPANARTVLTCLRPVFSRLLVLLSGGNKQEYMGRHGRPLFTPPEKLAASFKMAFLNTLRCLGYFWGTPREVPFPPAHVKRVPQNVGEEMVNIAYVRNPVEIEKLDDVNGKTAVEQNEKRLCVEVTKVTVEDQKKTEGGVSRDEGLKEVEDNEKQVEDNEKQVEDNEKQVEEALEVMKQVEEDRNEWRDKLQHELNEKKKRTMEALERTKEALKAQEEKKRRIQEARVRIKAKKMQWNKDYGLSQPQMLQENNGLGTDGNTGRRKKTGRTNRSSSTDSATNDELSQSQNAASRLTKKKRLQRSNQQTEMSTEEVGQRKQLDAQSGTLNDTSIPTNINKNKVGEHQLTLVSKSQADRGLMVSGLPQTQHLKETQPALLLEPERQGNTLGALPHAVAGQQSRQNEAQRNEVGSCYSQSETNTVKLQLTAESGQILPLVDAHNSVVVDSPEYIDISELTYLETRIVEVEPNRYSIVKVHKVNEWKPPVNEAKESLSDSGVESPSPSDSDGVVAAAAASSSLERFSAPEANRNKTGNVKNRLSQGSSVQLNTNADKILSVPVPCHIAEGVVILPQPDGNSQSTKETQPQSKLNLSGTGVKVLGNKPLEQPLKQRVHSENPRVAVVAPQGITSCKESSEPEKSGLPLPGSDVSVTKGQEKPMVIVKVEPWSVPDRWGSAANVDGKSSILWGEVIDLVDSDSELETCYSSVCVKDEVGVKEEFSGHVGSKDSQNPLSQEEESNSPSKRNLHNQSNDESVDTIDSSPLPPASKKSSSGSVSSASKSSLGSKVPKTSGTNACHPNESSSIANTEETPTSVKEVSHSSCLNSEISFPESSASSTAVPISSASLPVQDFVQFKNRNRKSTHPRKRTDNIVLMKFQSDKCSPKKKRPKSKAISDEMLSANSVKSRLPLDVLRIKPVVVLERLPAEIVNMFYCPEKRPPKQEVVRVVKEYVQRLAARKGTNKFSRKRKAESSKDIVDGKRTCPTSAREEAKAGSESTSAQETLSFPRNDTTFTQYHRGKTTVCSSPPACIYCGDFGPGDEIWVKCVKCLGWAHADCSGAVKSKFECDYCVFSSR